jgi:hypothetical protein
MTATDKRAPACDPKLCALAAHPHAHCSCGLPMAPGADVCVLCGRERLDPIEQPRRRGADDPAAWDGLSYPSRRRRRIGGDGDGYRQLIEVVLQPEEPGYLRLEGLSSRARRNARAVDRAASPAARRLARELADESGEFVLTGGGCDAG